MKVKKSKSLQKLLRGPRGPRGPKGDKGDPAEPLQGPSSVFLLPYEKRLQIAEAQIAGQQEQIRLLQKHMINTVKHVERIIREKDDLVRVALDAGLLAHRGDQR
jgi:hypothetical protein